MSNISSLFENLMTYNDSKMAIKRKHIKESDEKMINLSVQLPNDLEDITPEDVDVNVGVMDIDIDETDNSNNDEDIIVPEEDENDDDKPKNKSSKTDDEENESDDKDESEKKESVNIDKDCVCTGKSDCNCEKCKSKVESKDVDTAIANIRRRVSKNESLLHLDSASINKLITNFVKDNYKNIDKIVINKAVLENNILTLKGIIKDASGKRESVVLKNRGFNPAKLENSRFLIDFKDVSNTFEVMKEGAKLPFTFTATMKNKVLAFENLECNYKVKLNENKIAHVTGKYTLTESK